MWSSLSAQLDGTAQIWFNARKDKYLIQFLKNALLNVVMINIWLELHVYLKISLVVRQAEVINSSIYNVHVDRFMTINLMCASHATLIFI